MASGMFGREVPDELQGRANACLSEATYLENIVSELNRRKAPLFEQFRGKAADSLRAAIDAEIAAIWEAHSNLHSAAKALRDDAEYVREAIRQAEEEQRRRDQEASRR